MEEFLEQNEFFETSAISITPSNIIEYLYCPRYIYFMHVLGIPQHEEVYYKAMKGRNIHEMKKKTNPDYLRKKIGVIKKEIDVYLSSGNLRGIVDEILFLNNGTAAPLDYKYAIYNEKIYKTYKTQAHCYAKLIEENFNIPVKTAYLIFVRSKNKLVSVDITQKGIDEINKYVEEIITIIDGNIFPKATSVKSRCLTCTFRNLCVK